MNFQVLLQNDVTIITIPPCVRVFVFVCIMIDIVDIYKYNGKLFH